jgi:hypothetical protein
MGGTNGLSLLSKRERFDTRKVSISPNDQAERHAVALTQYEADLPKTSIPSLALLRRNPAIRSSRLLGNWFALASSLDVSPHFWGHAIRREKGKRHQRRLHCHYDEVIIQPNVLKPFPR